jgi:predicted phage terminase large subunit-like protein
MMHDLIDKPDLIIVDSGGAGLPILQDLQTRGYRHAFSAGDIPENQQSKGKITRFSKAMLYVYDGKVLFPESAPFLDTLFAELAAFPNGKYDDQVDSISQLVANLENALMFARHKHRPESGVYWLKPFR